MIEITADITLDDRVFDIMESVEMVRLMATQDVENVSLRSRGKEYL